MLCPVWEQGKGCSAGGRAGPALRESQKKRAETLFRPYQGEAERQRHRAIAFVIFVSFVVQEDSV